MPPSATPSLCGLRLQPATPPESVPRAHRGQPRNQLRRHRRGRRRPQRGAQQPRPARRRHYMTPPVPVSPGCHTYNEQLVINGWPVVTEAEQPDQPSETLIITTPVRPLPSDTATSTPATTATRLRHPRRPAAASATTHCANTAHQFPATHRGRRWSSLANTGINTAYAEMAGGTAIVTGCFLVLLPRHRRTQKEQTKARR